MGSLRGAGQTPGASTTVSQPTTRFVERLAAGPELVYVFWPTVMGYLRLVTHPAILPSPLRTAGEAEGFLDLYRTTSGDGARGNQVPDAHLAALMRQHGVGVIYSRDRDLRRYEGITVRDPVAP